MIAPVGEAAYAYVIDEKGIGPAFGGDRKECEARKLKRGD